MGSTERIAPNTGRSRIGDIKELRTIDGCDGIGTAKVGAINESAIGGVGSGIAVVADGPCGSDRVGSGNRCNRLQRARDGRPRESRVRCKNAAELPATKERSEESPSAAENRDLPEAVQRKPVAR